MSISEQKVRVKGGRCSARGARTRVQVSNTTDRLIDSFDKPKRRETYSKRICKDELESMIEQARQAMINHPDSLSAERRYKLLLNYKRSL